MTYISLYFKSHSMLHLSSEGINMNCNGQVLVTKDLGSEFEGFYDWLGKWILQ